MKNDLESLPLNTRREDSVKGYRFMVFIALIIRMRLQMIMKVTGLAKHYSVEKLFSNSKRSKYSHYLRGKSCNLKSVRKKGVFRSTKPMRLRIREVRIKGSRCHVGANFWAT